MLQLFRKYQKYIFYVVTAAIIISFVFFGSYQTFAPSMKGSDPVVATVGKQKIRQSLLDQTVLFLKTEQAGFPDPQTILTTNYLNGGVVSHLFLSSPLHTKVENYDEWLLAKQQSEQSFKPYVHPHAPMLTAESCWSLFAPELSKTLQSWQKGEVSFETRAKLYMEERKFPSPLLSQMLRYQENEYANMMSDIKLAKGELSLFGYHDLEEWFGRPYLEAAALLIFDGAAKAKQKGYVVTKEEVQTEILARTTSLYEGYRRELEEYITSPQAFFRAFVRYNGYEEATLLQIMESVMLFEKLLEDVSQAAMVDTLALEEFYAFAHEYATVEVTQMPEKLRFHDLAEWKKFELYLAAVAPQEGLGLPEKFDAIEKIKERAPKLVGERFELYVGKLEKRALEAKVSMKQTWDWEEQNLALLQERFPELKSKSLDEFEGKKRFAIDAYARSQIVEKNPQWIEEAFADVEMKEAKLFVTEGAELMGLKNLSKILEKDETVGYTEDGKNFYRILVMKRPKEAEVLPFEECPDLGDGLALIEKRRDQIDPALSLEEAMSRRFVSYLKEPKESIFPVVTKEMTLTRVEPSFIAMDDLVSGTSSVLVDQKEGAYFYRFIDKRVDRMIPQQKVVQAQQLLSQEIKEKYIASLI